MDDILPDPYEPSEYLTKGSQFIVTYKWYIFSCVVLIAFCWKRIQRVLDRWYDKYEARKYAAKYHKNPDLALERLEAVQQARQKMQEEFDRKAKEYEEKRKEKERQKALERKAKAEAENLNGGNRLGHGSTTSNTFRSEYNPLMGDTSRGYRPARRSTCPGGGCG